MALEAAVPAFGEGSPQDWRLPESKRKAKRRVRRANRQESTRIRVPYDNIPGDKNRRIVERLWDFNPNCWICGRRTQIPSRAPERFSVYGPQPLATRDHLISRWAPVRMQIEGLSAIACAPCNVERARIEEANLMSPSKFSPVMIGRSLRRAPESWRKINAGRIEAAERARAMDRSESPVRNPGYPASRKLA